MYTKNLNRNLPFATDFVRLFDGMLDDVNRLGGKDHLYNTPLVNVRSNEEGYWLELAVPGLRKEQFEISLEDDVLTVSASTEGQDAELGYTRREYSFLNFRRSFRLPKDVDPQSIGAKYEQGILTISLQKREEQKPKKIEVL